MFNAWDRSAIDLILDSTAKRCLNIDDVLSTDVESPGWDKEIYLGSYIRMDILSERFFFRAALFFIFFISGAVYDGIKRIGVPPFFEEVTEKKPGKCGV